MKLFAEPVGSWHRLAYLMGAIASTALSLFIFAGRAHADRVYWVNQNSIAYSNLDDTEGGFLSASVNAIRNGEGAAIDTANSRIYIAQEATNQIVWFGLDGVSSGVVNTAAGSVDHPTSVAIDPGTQILYWANDTVPGSIGFAHTDESGGGILAQPGSSAAHVSQPSRLVFDAVHRRLYWWNELSEDFSWVATNGQIGANLLTPGLAFTEPGKMGGIAIEPYSNPQELYFMNNEAGGIFHTDPLLGGAPEEILGAVTVKNAQEPIGLAFDGVANRFYWANRVTDEQPTEAIGTATLFGHPATVTVFPVAPIHSPAFATILKAPVNATQPELSVAGATVSCTLGSWEKDQPGSSVYMAPTSLGYQWKKGSVPIPGASGNSYTVTETGTYSCEVVAENAAGETGATSKPTTFSFPKPKAETTTTPKPTTAPKTTPTPKPAAVSAKLASTKAVKVKAGGTAVVGVDLTNSGGTTSGSAKVCGKLTKQAKKGLKAPKCVTVPSVAPKKTVVAKLKVGTRGSAHGIYKFTVKVSGATTASLIAKVQVSAANK